MTEIEFGRPHPADSEAEAISECIALSVLPTFELRCAGHAVTVPNRAQRLIALLAITTRPLSRSVVAARLWPDVVNARANASLRATLWSLPRLDRPLVVIDCNSLLLDTSIHVDFPRACRLADAILGGTAHPDTDGAESALSSDLLPMWSDEWLVTERERFRQLRLHALDELCLVYARAGQFGRAVTTGFASVSAEPTRESAHRALMTAHILEGNRMEAIRQYHTYSAMARAEMGIGPSEQLQQLFMTALQDARIGDTVTPQ